MRSGPRSNALASTRMELLSSAKSNLGSLGHLGALRMRQHPGGWVRDGRQSLKKCRTRRDNILAVLVVVAAVVAVVGVIYIYIVFGGCCCRCYCCIAGGALLLLLVQLP